MRVAAGSRAVPGGAGREPGFFGKVPSHGDFVASRFDRGLREILDDWLQRAMDQQRRALGDHWGRAFAAMPAWRFVLGAELAGRVPVIGVMVPSADRVGRAFPLIAAARVSGHRGPARTLSSLTDWFDRAETLLGRARHPDFDLDRFDLALERLVPVPPSDEPAGREARDDGRSYWWTRMPGGAARRFAAAGLPAPDTFERFLGSPDHPVAETTAQPDPHTLVAPRPSLGLRAVSASHAGTRLRLNADAMTAGERTDLHAVADGFGDHPADGQAARLLIDRVARAAPTDAIADLVLHVKGAFGTANTLLRAAAPAAGEAPGAAVAVLVAAGDSHAVVWSGDVRCYLLRDGLMRCLTRDHVEIGMRRRLARSIGGSAPFGCDAVSGELRAGDRFLVATASLFQILPEREVAARLGAPVFEGIADALVQDALVAGVAHNVSVIAAQPQPGAA